MKKSFFLFVLVFASTILLAQVKGGIGLKGGLNYAKLDISGISTSGKTGYHGGAFVLLRLGMIGIQPEFIFSQQGSEVNIAGWESDYVNIPLMLKIYLVAGLNIQMGPQFGFINKAELNGQNVENLVKNSDISAGLGIGWDAPLGFSADARYNLGISNNNSGLFNNSVKNQVFQLSLGFKIFRFGKK
jgi:hypothetical protein